MLPGFTVTDDLAFRALGWAFQQRLESVDVEAVTMLTAKEAAALLKISTQCFRRIAADHFDFERGNSRWSLKDIKQLADSRRIKRS
jgi:hypothetical protein